jgi:hypothetical protein
VTRSSEKSEIILYKTDDGSIKVDTVFLDETIWLTQAQMAELFDVKRPAITKHLKNIFESKELDEQVVSSILEHTTAHGAIEGKTQKQQVKYYNLDAIIAVGYRVNSKRATQFRIWVTHILKEYIIKGFAMNDDRLKQADRWDYFDEWLERIRDIRASEKRFYQKIRDIYATAIDYDKTSEQAQAFFKKVKMTGFGLATSTPACGTFPMIFLQIHPCTNDFRLKREIIQSLPGLLATPSKRT